MADLEETASLIVKRAQQDYDLDKAIKHLFEEMEAEYWISYPSPAHRRLGATWREWREGRLT